MIALLLSGPFWAVFLGLLLAHALCDLPPLQPGWLSDAKRGLDPALSAGAALAWHGAIHGLAVALITGSLWLGLAEALAHATIDAAKGAGRIGIVADQALHAGCKLAWALLAAGAI